MATLLNAVDATGAGTSVKWAGGRCNLQFYVDPDNGDWNGATAKVEYAIDEAGDTADGDLVWLSLGADAEKTANGVCNADLPVCKVRGNVTGASPAGLTIEMNKVVERTTDGEARR